MDSAIKRGALIVFEGCDRSGKSTQCKKILDALSLDNINVAADRFPGEHFVICSICQHWILGFTLFSFLDRTTEIGKLINRYLTNTTELNDNAIHLLFCANRWEKR